MQFDFDNIVLSLPWHIAGEGEGDGGSGDGGTGDGGAGDGGGGGGEKTFTQKQVNDMIAAEKGKYQGDLKKLNDEINALRSKDRLTGAEREELDSKISEMEGKLLTAEEKARRDAKKAETQHKREVDELNDKHSKLWTKYKSETIGRAITDAANNKDVEAISASQTSR